MRRFGAKGDGKADDTAALEFALAAANAVPGVVHLPAGTYRLSRPLTITAGGVVLRGDGVSTAGGCFGRPACLPAVALARLPPTISPRTS